jgi:chemotaxis protein MotB
VNLRTAWDQVRGDQLEGVWMISYSDMMTLLLTFFVTLLSVAKIQKHKFELISEALSQKKSEGDLRQLERRLEAWIKESNLERQVAVELGPEGLRLQFVNALLFDSGKAALREEGGAAVDRFLKLFAALDASYRVTVEGYSDDVPISNGQFKSNWELSAQRAIEVLERLRSGGVAKERLTIQAFAETRPVRPSEMPKGLSPEAQLDFVRSLNRRVVMVVN